MPGYNTDTYAGFRHHYTVTTESATITPPELNTDLTVTDYAYIISASGTVEFYSG